MMHQQILDKLSAKHLIQAIDEDLASLTFDAICYEKNTTVAQLSYILPKLLLRWNCVLFADEGISATYKQKTIIALAVLLHKYGFADKFITKNALQAIDKLNKDIALSDDFFRKSNEIKAFINSMPAPLKRKPAIAESITFYRAEDVVSIQLEGKFYAAYIHQLSGPNESPIIELYDGVFSKVPTLNELGKLNAKGRIYNDGKERICLFSINGMKYLPDPANQIQLISACVEKRPSNEHLTESVGLYAVLDIFRLQGVIKEMFAFETE